MDQLLFHSCTRSALHRRRQPCLDPLCKCTRRCASCSQTVHVRLGLAEVVRAWGCMARSVSAPYRSGTQAQRQAHTAPNPAGECAFVASSCQVNDCFVCLALSSTQVDHSQPPIDQPGINTPWISRSTTMSSTPDRELDAERGRVATYFSFGISSRSAHCSLSNHHSLQSSTHPQSRTSQDHSQSQSRAQAVHKGESTRLTCFALTKR